MKNVCAYLKEHAKNIVDFEKKKKKMLLLPKEELKSHQDAKACYICEKRILKKLSESINCQKVSDHCHYAGKYRGKAHSIYNLKFNVPNESDEAFQINSNYDYHFIIKELTNAFEEKFECLGENTEKYITFSVPIVKEVTKIDKDGNETDVTISDKINQFIDSA